MLNTIARGIAVTAATAALVGGASAGAAQAQVYDGAVQAHTQVVPRHDGREIETAPNTRDMGQAQATPAGCVVRARITGDWVRIREGAWGRVVGYAFRSDAISVDLNDPEHYAPPGWYSVNDYTQHLYLFDISAQYVEVHNSCAS